MIWETQDDSFPYRPESFQEAPEMKVSLAAVCKFEKKKKKAVLLFSLEKIHLERILSSLIHCSAYWLIY